MTLLVFGRTGQVAREILRLAPHATALGREDADLMQPETCAEAIRSRHPSAVINAAAWTAVDAAEKNGDAAHRVNAEAPAAMARAAAEAGIPLVHISTDYVFDGSGDRPWRPDDPTCPLGVYGASKLAGETAIRDAGGPHAILRTSWVFSAHGQNFVKTMLRLSETRQSLNIVDDQVGGPTPARSIATACIGIADALKADPGKSGTFHFAGSPDTSWAGFARAIFAAAGRNVEVRGIPSSDYPTPAARPMNSRLDCTGTLTGFGLDRPDWRAGLGDILNELGASTE